MTLRTRLADTVPGSSERPSLLLVSDTYVGATLAGEFDPATVRLVTDREAVAARAPDGVRTTVGDVTAIETLTPVDAATAVVALGRDRQALLVTQLLRTRFGVEDIVVLLNDPERRDAVAAVATTVVCGSSCLSGELHRAVEPSLSEPPESHS